MNLIEVSFDRTCDKSTALANHAEARLMETIHPHHGLCMILRCYVEHDMRIIKATISLPSRPNIMIEAKSRNMYTTVSILIPKIRRYIQHVMSIMHRDKKYYDHRKAA